jgi:hypothetical protein
MIYPSSNDWCFLMKNIQGIETTGYLHHIIHKRNVSFKIIDGYLSYLSSNYSWLYNPQPFG